MLRLCVASSIATLEKLDTRNVASIETSERLRLTTWQPTSCTGPQVVRALVAAGRLLVRFQPWYAAQLAP
jgi:hypothetical protein